MSRLILKFWKKGGREFAMDFGVAGTQEVVFYCTRFYFPVDSVFFCFSCGLLVFDSFSSHGMRQPLPPGRGRALAGGSMLVCQAPRAP